MDPATITLYVQEGEAIVELGVAAYNEVRSLFTKGGATDADDDAALAKLDALYAARIEQAQKDAAGGETPGA